jgi:hypothetical protein
MSDVLAFVGFVLILLWAALLFVDAVRLVIWAWRPGKQRNSAEPA